MKRIGLILAFELVLAYVIPISIISEHPYLQYFVDVVNWFAPVVKNFNKIAKYPEVLQVYFAITVLLIPLKGYFVYRWLMNSMKGNYRHFVIPPP